MPWDKEKKNGELWSSVLLIYGIYFGLLVPILWLSNVVGGKQQEQQKTEANFRVAHSRIKLNADSINFYGGEAKEQAILDMQLPVIEEGAGLRFFWIAF